MIACKVAAMVPDRVLSLALLNVTGGGFQCFPKVLFNIFRHEYNTFVQNVLLFLLHWADGASVI